MKAISPKHALLRAALVLSLASPALAAWAGPTVTVYKSPYCGCCQYWVQHMKEAGFDVREVETHDLAAQRKKAGIPDKLASCHVSEVEGYSLEGHVPASEVRKLLKARPAIRGLAVPGMPANAPGMGEPHSAPAFSVMQVHLDGSSREYSKWPAAAGVR